MDTVTGSEAADPSCRLLPAPAGWPPTLAAEFAARQLNGAIGSRLVSETERVRVWTITLEPGQRLPFHRHVLDSFWTVMSEGEGVSNLSDGSRLERRYGPGQTEHRAFAAGEFLVHDLANTGSTRLLFTTVEFLDSPNRPLPL